ncbi:MAG: glycosyl transferase [Microbacterium sp.]|nr:MAG: glycosyl transferase [Microbacterium sp.]
MSDRVVVVVRTKNRPDFLRRALADIAAQTYADVAIVVVNDGGDRALVEDVSRSSSVRDRVTVLDSNQPGGRSAAANTGVRAVEAEFVVLHDDDDLWHPSFLADTVAWLDAHPSHGGVSAATEIVYEEFRDGTWTESGRAPFWRDMTHVSLADMLLINRVVPISMLYRRRLHEIHGGYDERLEAVEDWDFYLRVMRTHEIGYLAGPPRAFWSQRPSAIGDSANSMFGLAFQHERDDAAVRDRALAEWVGSNGLALPLYIASVEKRLQAEFSRELSVSLARQREEIVALVHERHPLWRRLRSIRARLFRSRASDGA